jgi:ribosome biogenesis protein SSF1/2
MPKRGGKRVKKRTHVAEVDDSPDNTGAAVPRSLVIKQPKTALPHTLAILQQELRKIMSPNTAQKLQERKYNTLKDYTHFAGLMKVTHLLLLAPGGKRQLKAPAPDPSTEAAVTAGAGALFKIARLPTGPTLTMRIEKYSLCRQVRRITSGMNTISPSLARAERCR